MSRIERLRAALAEAGLDGIYVSAPVDDVNRKHAQNRRYLTGFTGSTGHAVVTADRAILAADSRYTAQAAEEAGARGFEVFDIGGGIAKWLPGLIDAAGLKGKRLGLSQADLSYGAYVAMTEIVDGMAAEDRPELVAAPAMIERLRSVKDREEIGLIATAIEAAETAFRSVRERLEPGWTEQKVADELEVAVKAAGARGFSFEPIVGSGPNGARPHAGLTERVIEAGEPVVVDWGAEVEGYCSDLTRTFHLGPEPERFAEIHGVVAAAQRAAIEAIEPGMTGGEVDAVARGVIADAGFGELFTHGLGHGVGLDVHDYPPYLGPGSEDVLEPGMVFTVEPGVYVPGWGGVRIEDIVVLEAGGARLLSRLEQG